MIKPFTAEGGEHYARLCLGRCTTRTVTNPRIEHFQTTHYIDGVRTYIVRTEVDGTASDVKDSATAAAHLNKMLERYDCAVHICALDGGAVAVCGGPVCSGFAPSCRSPRADELAFRTAVRAKMPKTRGIKERIRTVLALAQHVSALSVAEAHAAQEGGAA